MFLKGKKIVCLILCMVLSLSACGGGSDNPGTLPGEDKITTDETSVKSTDSVTEPVTTEKTTKATTTVPPTSAEPLADYPFEPASTGIYVTRDGNIKSAEVTSFDNKKYVQVRYDEAGLRAFVDQEIAAYNSEKKSDAVILDELSVKNGEATLILSYANVNYFLEFQGSDFEVKYLALMSRENAVKNYNISKLVDTSGQPVDLLVALERDDVKVLVVTGKTLITVNGDVLYTSQSMTLNGRNVVRSEDDINYSFVIFR